MADGLAESDEEALGDVVKARQWGLQVVLKMALKMVMLRAANWGWQMD